MKAAGPHRRPQKSCHRRLLGRQKKRQSEKFYQHEDLRTMLADTGDRELIEDSPVSAKLFAEGIRNVSLMASSDRLMHSGDVGTMGAEGMS